jgi:hypothetical protein
MPWGIEIQLWRLVETRTYPHEAQRLPLSSIFSEGESPGALPQPRGEDENTLENPIGETTLEDVVESDYADPEDGGTSGSGGGGQP